MKNEENKKGKVYIAVAAIVIIVGAIAFFKPEADTKNADISQPVLTEVTKSQKEPVTARIDITTKLIDAEKPQFEVYVDGSDMPEKQAGWIVSRGLQGYVIQKKGNSIDLIIKAIKDIDINFVLRGVRDEKNGKLVEHWVTYTSLIINDEKILSKEKTVWYNKSYRQRIQAKSGDIYRIHIDW